LAKKTKTEPKIVEGVDVSQDVVTIEAKVVPNDDTVTPTVTVVTQADEHGRPLSERTLLEMATGREALKAYHGYVEPFANDHNGQQRGNFEAPRLQFAEVDPNVVPTFKTVATPFEPGQE
jgi:hypothetical protein